MRGDEAVEERIERGLGSVGKLRILRLLLQRPDHAFTRYEIGKLVPLNPTSIRSDINTLVKIGWVIELKIGHLRKYSINLETPLTRRLAEFLHEVKYIRGRQHP